MAWVEDINKRSQKAKHFYDASTDQWQAEFTISDRHYKDDTDAWQDVEENLVNDTGGFDKKCDKTRHIFKIASGGARRWQPRRNVATEYVDVTNLQYFQGTWKNLNLPAAVWKSQGAEWDLANLYASITNTWRSIKADFILKDGTTPTRLRFQLGLTGLTYNHTTGTLTSIADGLVWGYIQKPTAEDANGVIVPVSSTYDGTYIEWSADTTGATFPIAIDPTFTDGYGGDVNSAYDTYLKGDLRDANFGTANYLIHFDFRTKDPPDFSCASSLYKFVLSSLEGKTITDANLYLYGYNTQYISNTTYVRRILSGSSGWTETTATFNNADTGVSWAGDTGQDGGADAGCSVDNTDTSSTNLSSKNYSPGRNEYVGEEFNFALDLTEFGLTIANNYGLYLWGGTLYVCSSDHATTGYRPKLVVVYQDSGVTIPLGIA